MTKEKRRDDSKDMPYNWFDFVFQPVDHRANGKSLLNRMSLVSDSRDVDCVGNYFTKKMMVLGFPTSI